MSKPWIATSGWRPPRKQGKITTFIGSQAAGGFPLATAGRWNGPGPLMRKLTVLFLQNPTLERKDRKKPRKKRSRKSFARLPEKAEKALLLRRIG